MRKRRWLMLLLMVVVVCAYYGMVHHRGQDNRNTRTNRNTSVMSNQRNLLRPKHFQKQQQHLLQMYLATYQEMKLLPRNMATEACPLVLRDHKSPCWIQNCNASFPPLPQRLNQLLQTQQPIAKEHRDLIDTMANQSKHFDLVFVTAASSNHYEESQGLIRDLHLDVFPELERQKKYTFHLYYYDLGLTPGQLRQLKHHCKCTVVSFPFAGLPSDFEKLNTYMWKPLIVRAHLSLSRFTLWMDASMRFVTRDLSPILQQSRRLGVLLARSTAMMPRNTHPDTLAHFQVQPCLLASFYEVASGFVALRNDPFVSGAIVDSWVACAFSPNCLCPRSRGRDGSKKNGDGVDCRSYHTCKERSDRYFRCHRFDQSALGVILALLFDWRVSELTDGLVVADRPTPWFAFKRDDNGKVKYFPEEEEEEEE